MSRWDILKKRQTRLRKDITSMLDSFLIGTVAKSPSMTGHSLTDGGNHGARSRRYRHPAPDPGDPLSAWAGVLPSILPSLVQTARRQDVHPREFLQTLLTADTATAQAALKSDAQILG